MSGITGTSRDGSGNTTVTLKVPAGEADRWQKEADIAGVTRSEWIRRRCALTEAETRPRVRVPSADEVRSMSGQTEPILLPTTSLPAREFRGPDPKPASAKKAKR